MDPDSFYTGVTLLVLCTGLGILYLMLTLVLAGVAGFNRHSTSALAANGRLDERDRIAHD